MPLRTGPSRTTVWLASEYRQSRPLLEAGPPEAGDDDRDVSDSRLLMVVISAVAVVARRLEMAASHPSGDYRRWARPYSRAADPTTGSRSRIGAGVAAGHLFVRGEDELAGVSFQLPPDLIACIGCVVFTTVDGAAATHWLLGFRGRSALFWAPSSRRPTPWRRFDRTKIAAFEAPPRHPGRARGSPMTPRRCSVSIRGSGGQRRGRFLWASRRERWRPSSRCECCGVSAWLAHASLTSLGPRAPASRFCSRS